MWRIGIAVLAISLALQPGNGPAGPGFRSCDGVAADVAAEVAEDGRLACQGAGDAIAFFRAMRLRIATDLRLSVVHSLPPPVSASAVGCFMERDGLVLMLPYGAFLLEKTWFRVPVEPALYRSLAAHEVAHALAARNFSIPNPTIQAKEYVAYVVMYEVMDPALRARVLAANPAEGAGPVIRLTELLCLVEPMRFGIQAYRHHMRPGIGMPFLRRVLDGAELTD